MGLRWEHIFFYHKWVSNAKISAQKSNFEKTDHLLGKVTESYFQTLIKLWSGDLGKILCDEFIWEIWLISETWLDCSKLTYNTCNSTNKGSKNWSITFKGHKAVLLKAILAKTSNFWPIGPIELKFWHLVLKMIHFNISLWRSHGSSFRPLWWLLLGPQRSKKFKNWLGTIFEVILAYLKDLVEFCWLVSVLAGNFEKSARFPAKTETSRQNSTKS